jgi:hypothetical protein
VRDSDAAVNRRRGWPDHPRCDGERPHPSGFDLRPGRRTLFRPGHEPRGSGRESEPPVCEIKNWTWHGTDAFSGTSEKDVWGSPRTPPRSRGGPRPGWVTVRNSFPGIGGVHKKLFQLEKPKEETGAKCRGRMPCRRRCARLWSRFRFIALSHSGREQTEGDGARPPPFRRGTGAALGSLLSVALSSAPVNDSIMPGSGNVKKGHG